MSHIRPKGWISRLIYCWSAARRLELAGLEALLSESLHLPVKTSAYLMNASLSSEILKRSFANNISFLNLISRQFAYDGLKIDLTLEEIKDAPGHRGKRPRISQDRGLCPG